MLDTQHLSLMSWHNIHLGKVNVHLMVSIWQEDRTVTSIARDLEHDCDMKKYRLKDLSRS